MAFFLFYERSATNPGIITVWVPLVTGAVQTLPSLLIHRTCLWTCKTLCLARSSRFWCKLQHSNSCDYRMPPMQRIKKEWCTPRQVCSGCAVCAGAYFLYCVPLSQGVRIVHWSYSCPEPVLTFDVMALLKPKQHNRKIQLFSIYRWIPHGDPCLMMS